MKNKQIFGFSSLVIVIAFLSFTSSCTKPLTDIDGNEYKTVKIGDQVWMAENLKVTRYRNGDFIETTTPATLDITDKTEPKYQWAYGGDEGNVADYGRLYTWYAVTDSRNICPEGWHVLTDAEWVKLANYFGGETLAATKLKEIGYDHWNSSNIVSTNSSGFTALPGGGRGNNGVFGGMGFYGSWWSSTENEAVTAGYWYMYYNVNTVKKTTFHKNSGFSVRCVKDVK